MKNINIETIEEKIANLIKADIKKKGLVSSGKMVDSIRVEASNGGFTIKAVDYFEHVNDKYKITEDVFNSQAFIDLIIDTASGQIIDEITG